MKVTATYHGGYAATLLPPNAMYLGVLIPLGLAVGSSVMLQRAMRAAAADSRTEPTSATAR